MASHEPKLGQLIDPYQKRDAIHIAIAPVIALEHLNPGEPIGFMEDDNERVGSVAEPIGIVDPFLKEPVGPGDRFYMFLYPQTITSLRHNWTHPAFDDEETGGVTRSARSIASEKWLRYFLHERGPDYDAVIAAAQSPDGSSQEDDYNGVLIEPDRLLSLGTEVYGEIPDEFWDHVENVIGKKVKMRPTHFSCSC